MSGSAQASTVAVSDNERLHKLCRDNLQSYIKSGKYAAPPIEYYRRLEHEIKVFNNSGYSSVILIIADYIRWAKANGIVVGPGRGSAAGSLVVFLSGITTIDPLKFGLIFERFLNPERISLPDIDTDFSDRDAVIDYLREKYGQNRVAKVGVPSLYKPRSAIDELSQTYQLEFNEAKRITKLIGDAKTFDEAFEAEPTLAEYESKYPELFRFARSLQGYVRQLTTHPSAVIMARGPIGAEIPMQRPPGEAAATGQLATGWDGEELDSLGYVKLDILTVDNLSIISRAIKMIGNDIDFYNLPLDDKRTLQGFERGETVAVFQFEEPKSVAILQNLRGIEFRDVAAVNALIRPGLDVGQFISARNAGTAEYIMPDLAPILSDTHGVILYQEQVMRICVDIAGFSMAKADKVRKIIAKTANSSSDKGLAEIYDDFKAGCIANGYDDISVEALWDKILACQKYIFNKSHAVCYGYIAYADMFLKQHYPLQFMCSALQTKSREIYIKECERLGIKILQPDVNKSMESYSIEGDAIRMGLECIKHVGSKAKQIIARRPYTDEYEFVERVKPNTNQIQSLVFGGALDCFGDRASIAKFLCKESIHDEVTLGELATREKEVLGFYLVHNPLSHFKEQLAKCITPESKKLPMNALVGGMVSKVKEHQAKSGTMAFVALLTVDGEMDVIVWPSDWPKCKHRIKVGNVIQAVGRKTDKGNYSMTDIAVLRENK